MNLLKKKTLQKLLCQPLIPNHRKVKTPNFGFHSVFMFHCGNVEHRCLMSCLAEADDDRTDCVLCLLMWVCLKTWYSTLPQKDRSNRTHDDEPPIHRYPIFRQSRILICTRSEQFGMYQKLCLSSIYVGGWTSSPKNQRVWCFFRRKNDKMMGALLTRVLWC